MIPSSANLLAEVVVDIDNTVFIQGAIFLLLMFVLNSLLFRPWLEVRARRHERIEGSMLKADELRSKAKELEVRFVARMDEANLAAGDLRAAARHDAEHHADEQLVAARAKAGDALKSARDKIGADAAEARSSLSARVDELGTQIANKLLGSAS